MVRICAIALIALLLTACSRGGGGSSSAATLQPPTPTPTPTPAPVPDPEPQPDSGAPFLLDETTRALIQPAEQTAISDQVIFCAVTLREDQACTLNHLPLLGMVAPSPSVDDVMSRVVVTHPWMAVRFRAMMEWMPPEILLLMRGVTAVVISSHVRPSFYTARTGAIYLDPNGMWLTEAEQADISTAADPRTDDIRQFQFLMLWRYVIDSVDIRSLPRSVDALSLRMAALLYHELAHANDFFPPDSFDTLDRTIPLFENLMTGLLPSTQLSNTLPLQSSFMRSLAQVAFRGVTPTPDQLETTANDIANAFPLDHANDFYSYSTIREDLAMVFEEALMLYTLGIDRDVGVVTVPDELESCSQLILAWGQRGRIAESGISPRSLFAIERLLPEAVPGIEDMLADLPPPTALTVGMDWCRSIAPESSDPVALTLDELPLEERVQFLPGYH